MTDILGKPYNVYLFIVIGGNWDVHLIKYV